MRSLAFRSSSRMLALAALLGSTACFDLSNPMDPVVGGGLREIRVESDGFVEVGDTMVVSATGWLDGLIGMFSYAPILDARWSITPASVARLEPLGPPPADSFQQARTLVRGVSPGAAVVTATSSGKSGSTTVHVIPRVAALEVTLSANTVTVGDTLSVTIRLVDQTGAAVTGPVLVPEREGLEFAAQ